MISRKRFMWAVVSLVGLLASIAFPQTLPLDYYPTEGWRTSTPEAQGMDSGRLADMFEQIRAQGFHFHSILVIRNGYLVAEANLYPFTPDRIQDIHSITKSVVATLFGMAVDRDYFPDWQSARVVDLFSDREIANLDRRKQFMRVEHLLHMTTGLDWPEWEVSIRSPDNILSEMRASPDPVQFVLDRPMATWPGREWNYNSGGWHLISALLFKATGVIPETFAAEELFRPLGISAWSWNRDKRGLSWGGWGLQLRPRDLAKIGLLYLQMGQWEGEQVLSERWVKVATHPAIPVPETEGYYGYGWWSTRDADWRPEDPPLTFFGAGGFGDLLLVDPYMRLILVITASLGVDESGAAEVLAQGMLESVREDVPLPEDPEAFARLQEALAALSLPPSQEAGLPANLPRTAHEISGTLYRLEDNPFLRGFRLTFLEDAAFFTVVTNTGWMVRMPLSFDGVMRFRELYHPPVHWGAIGEWKGERRLDIVYEVPEYTERVLVRIEFQDRGVSCEFTSLFDGYTVRVNGR